MRSGFFAAAVALSMGAAALPVKAAEPEAVLSPAQGKSFKVGADVAVGYYMARAGACDVTLTVGTAGAADEVRGAGARVRFTVLPGRPAHYERPDGGLRFDCGPGAAKLMVQPVERVALAGPQS